MDPQIENWVLSLLSALVVLQIAWVAWITRSLAVLSVEMARDYVHKATLDTFDSRTTVVLNHMASQIEAILKALYELKGASGK